MKCIVALVSVIAGLCVPAVGVLAQETRTTKDAGPSKPQVVWSSEEEKLAATQAEAANGMASGSQLPPRILSVGPASQYDNNTPTPIPDVSTTDIPIVVSGFTGLIGKVTISLHLTHTFDTDLDMFLLSPDGTSVELSTDNGSIGNNYGVSCAPADRTTFDDNAPISIVESGAPFAGTFAPEAPLAAFIGKSGVQVNGVWTLRITDDANTDTGTFQCASLFVAPSFGFDVESLALTGGNGNAVLDFNECNELSVTLKSVDPEALSNIVGTISVATPGMTVVQASSTFPDLAYGASGANATPFVIGAAPDLACDTPVQVTLTLTYTGGTGSDVHTFMLPRQAAQFDNNTVTAIPDLGSVDIPILVSGLTAPITNVTVALHVTHTFDSDLVISLLSPDGTSVTLANRRGGSGDNYGASCANRTNLDDSVFPPISAGGAPFLGTFRPESPLSAFDGKSGGDANGTWMLHIEDKAGLDVGTFQCASLFIQPICVDGGGTCCPVLIALNDVAQRQGVDALLRVPDPDAGVAELVGSLGDNFSDSEAMAVGPHAGVCPLGRTPAQDHVFVVDNDRLVELDPLTGNGTLIGPIGFQSVDGIAFHPQTSELYGVTYGTNMLIRIDTATGAGTLVAPDVKQGHRLNDLAFHPNGDAYLLTDDGKIYKMDIATGETPAKWVLSGAYSMESLLWGCGPDPVLYSAADRGGFKDLVTIALSTDDSQTGVATFVSAEHSGFGDIEALALVKRETATTLFTVQAPTSAAPAVHAFRLGQNVPNPFNPATHISFELLRPGTAEVHVYDVAGRSVATLFRGNLDAGWHEVLWDGRLQSGAPASAGVYRYTLSVDGTKESRSMVLIK